jgi:hypothetical protein
MEAGAHRQKVARPGVAEEQEDLGGEIEVCGPGRRQRAKEELPWRTPQRSGKSREAFRRVALGDDHF